MNSRASRCARAVALHAVIATLVLAAAPLARAQVDDRSRRQRERERAAELESERELARWVLSAGTSRGRAATARQLRFSIASLNEAIDGVDRSEPLALVAGGGVMLAGGATVAILAPMIVELTGAYACSLRLFWPGPCERSQFPEEAYWAIGIGVGVALAGVVLIAIGAEPLRVANHERTRLSRRRDRREHWLRMLESVQLGVGAGSLSFRASF